MFCRFIQNYLNPHILIFNELKYENITLTMVSKSSSNWEHMALMLGDTAFDFKDIKIFASG